MKFKKKKMGREERAEFKFGKYMGGPAEEKAEMKKKKTKRMADGGEVLRTMTSKASNLFGSFRTAKDGAKDGANAAAGGGRGTGLPPGLAKRKTLPPGLAKKAQLPPGLRAGFKDAPKPLDSMKFDKPAATPATPATPPAPAAKKPASMNNWKAMKAGGKVKRMAAGGPVLSDGNPGDMIPKQTFTSTSQPPRTAAAPTNGRGNGLPPGLAKRGPGNLPPGLKNMAQLPPGLRSQAPAPMPPSPIYGQPGSGYNPAPAATPVGGKIGDYINTGIVPPMMPPSAPALQSMPTSNAVKAAPVKTMKAGGMVRGNGCAARGKTKGRMY